MIKLKPILLEILKEYYESDEDRHKAELYFSIGQEDDESTKNNYCWIWSRADQGLRVKKGGTHGVNFGHEIAGNTFKGWYDVEKNAISIVFPECVRRKLDKEPTVDDIPTQIYDALVRKFGNAKNNSPKFYVFENKLNENADVDYDAASDYFERLDAQLLDLADLLKRSKGKGRVPWKTIPASLLKRVWLQFGKYNRINENDLDKIADQMLTNIARLEASTEMMGHTQRDVRPELEDNGYVFTDEEWDEWMSNYFTNNKVSWMISDYGLPKLNKIYAEIFNADTSEKKLYAIDKALNVVHQRYDLAAMFVQGGTATLNDIANQGGYVAPENT